MELLEKVVAVRAGAAVGVLFLATAVLTLVGAGTHAWLLVMLALCAVVSLTLTLPYAALVAVSAWALLTGFAVNTGGQLTFAGSDVRHLLLILAVGVLARSCARYSPGSRV